MPAPTILEELAVYGPAAASAAVSRAEAESYCRRLAKTHYENFSVASWLLPRALRQDFYNVYAYCRWADDLADETGDAAQSLRLLDWWEAELERCYAGEATHPVFVALRSTIETFDLPQQPLADLLIAFRRDQVQTRYATYDELLDYCRYSANPVGRIVLHLGQSYSEGNAVLSDKICTGLQLVNHCQDVGRDLDRGRIYLPQEELQGIDLHEAVLPAFRDVLKRNVDRAEALLEQGRGLIDRVQPALRLQVHLFVHGGLATVEAIRAQEYDVLDLRRPTVSKWRKAWLVFDAWRYRGPR
jgi:squalene synthase HpnC